MTNKKGFTLIEVVLFLAITGLMLIGVLIGIGARVAVQRYNDTVQDVDDLLTKTYASVINVENSREDVAFNQAYCNGYLQDKALQQGKSVGEVINTTDSTHAGRSRCAIYGKLLTFGEQNGRVNIYTVIGRLESSDLANDDQAVSSTIAALKKVGADIYAYDYANSSCTINSAGVFESHNLIWDSSIQRTGAKETLKGALLIVRSPISGTVHTYRLKDNTSIDMQQYFGGTNVFACSAATINSKNSQVANGSLMRHMENGDFIESDLDICIDSPDLYAVGGRRRNIRVLADGRNASAVKLVDTDSEDYRCGL